MSQIDDEGLTHHETPISGDNGEVLIIGCGALAREILALKSVNSLNHIDLICLPAILHNHPEKIPDAVEAAILKHQDHYDKIAVAYADCGTGGRLQSVCDKMGADMISGPHCYAFYEGIDAFAAQEGRNLTAFFLTDFLVRQFNAFVWKPLGLDRHPELLSMYFGNYERLVYQSQSLDHDLIALAQRHAERMGLRFEHVHTGYGDLAHWMLGKPENH